MESEIEKRDRKMYKELEIAWKVLLKLSVEAFYRGDLEMRDAYSASMSIVETTMLIIEGNGVLEIDL